MKNVMRCRVITPDGEKISAECDDVVLNAADGTDGKNGGSVGIRKNHIKALIALESGAVKAYSRGERVIDVMISGGYATVNNNTVTVITDSAGENAAGNCPQK